MNAVFDVFIGQDGFGGLVYFHVREGFFAEFRCSKNDVERGATVRTEVTSKF